MLLAADASGARIAATPEGRARCPLCAEGLIPKCGELVRWHWSHRARTDCDPWSEPESEWHYAWKMHVGDEIEVTIRRGVLGADGTPEITSAHRCDAIVLVPRPGREPDRRRVEIQHSALSVESIWERERFYGDLTWIWDLRDVGDRLRVKPRRERWSGGGFLPCSWHWRHPRRSLLACRRRMLWDLGEEGLLMPTDARDGDHSGVIGFGRLLPREAVREWIRGTPGGRTEWSPWYRGESRSLAEPHV